MKTNELIAIQSYFKFMGERNLLSQKGKDIQEVIRIELLRRMHNSIATYRFNILLNENLKMLGKTKAHKIRYGVQS